MNKIWKVIAILMTVTFILSGCTEKNSTNSISNKTLTNQEKAIAAYVESYSIQKEIDSPLRAIKKIEKQTEFTINKKDGNHFEINHFPKATSGVFSSDITVGKKQTVAKVYVDGEYTETKSYTNWSLIKAFAAHKNEIQKLCDLSTENKDNTTMMSDDELIIATYLEDKMSGNINTRISKLRENPYFIMEPFNEGYSVNRGDSDTEENILVSNNGVYIANGSQDAKYKITDINEKYKSYENKINSLVKQGKQAFQEAQPEIIED